MGRKGKFRPPSKRERTESAAADTDPDPSNENPYVSRGGLKLRRALDAFESDEFGLDVAGLWCADLGCSTGGFSDCLLQAGADRVYSVDTAYGELAWKVRTDERVVVMERSNAVHTEVPGEVIERGGVDLVVIDLGWTAQAKAIPAALRWVRDASGRIISLIKPHYEVSKDELGEGGVLDPSRAEAMTEEVLAAMPGLGVRVLGCVESPLLGGRLGGKKKGAGNREWLAFLESATSRS